MKKHRTIIKKELFKNVTITIKIEILEIEEEEEVDVMMVDVMTAGMEVQCP
jgi:hypothetical protein